MTDEIKTPQGNRIDLTPRAEAIMRLMASGIMPDFSQMNRTGKFGPGEPVMPLDPETEPRVFQYQPGVNLIMKPRAGFGHLLSFEALRSMASTCKEIRLNIEHIKRQMRGIEWEIIPVKKEPVEVAGSLYVGTPDVSAVEEFMKKPNGTDAFDSWLNMIVEEILVTDALTLWPHTEAMVTKWVDVIDGTTIRPLLDMRGKLPQPPLPAYIQNLHGVPMSSYPYNTMMYRPLNTKVNTPYGESPTEWILTSINTSIRYDLSRLGYFTDGNIPGAFYSVPESWTPEQIEWFNNYIDALFLGDPSRLSRLLAVPGGTGSHVTQFRNNDFDNPALNEFLMRVACWAFGNNPAEFGLVSGSGLGGAGFMEGANAIQFRSLIGPLSDFIGGVLTEIIQVYLGRPELKMAAKNSKSIEERTAQSALDKSNVDMGVYNVAYIQERDAIPQMYRPKEAPQAKGPVPLPAEYEAYLKRAVDADLKAWEAKAQKALKKNWGPATWTSDVLPAKMIEDLNKALKDAKTEKDIKQCFSYIRGGDYFSGLGFVGVDYGLPSDTSGGAVFKMKTTFSHMPVSQIVAESELTNTVGDYLAGLRDRIAKYAQDNLDKE